MVDVPVHTTFTPVMHAFEEKNTPCRPLAVKSHPREGGVHLSTSTRILIMKCQQHEPYRVVEEGPG
jgi:hypothetical protein